SGGEEGGSPSEVAAPDDVEVENLGGVGFDGQLDAVGEVYAGFREVDGIRPEVSVGAAYCAVGDEQDAVLKSEGIDAPLGSRVIGGFVYDAAGGVFDEGEVAVFGT